jgi:oligosaccharide repeat unit polymerase
MYNKVMKNLKTKPIYNWQFFLVALLLFALPFERLLTIEFQGFTIKPSYLAGIILIITFAFSFKEGLKSFFSKIKFDKSEIILLLFSAWSYLGLFWTPDKKRTFVISSLYLFVFLVYLVLKRVVKKEWLPRIFNIIVWLGVLTSIFSFWQFFADTMGLSQNISTLRDYYTKQIFGFPRVQSTFLEPLYFGNFLIIPIFIAIYHFFEKPMPRKALPVLIMTLALFLTMSRGAIYGLVGGLTIFLFFYIIKIKQIKTAIFTVLIVLAGFGLSLGAVSLSSKTGAKDYLNHAKQNEVLDSLGGSLGSVDITNRNYTVPLAIEKIKQGNYLGLGAGAFGSLPQFKLLRENGAYQTVNNLYL